MNLLTVNDLSFQREGYFAFKHVTFSLSQKESISITGDNGSGKTALLETLVGLNFPDSGQARYGAGVRIAFMPQIETEVVQEPVRDYLEIRRQATGELAVSNAQLKDLTSFMGMSPYLDHPVDTLSRGLSQRLSFLLAVCQRPNVLILDDPFSFQNSFYAHQMVEIFQDLKEHGAGIIVAGSIKDTTLSDEFDYKYLLQQKSLSPVQTGRGQNYLLAFKATSDSMAITKEVGQYVTGTFDGQIQLRVSYNQKETILKAMLEMNYLFEGMVDLEV